MSITINPDRDNKGPAQQPKKNIFGAATNRALAQDGKRVGVYTAGTDVDGLAKEVARVASGAWYTGDKKLVSVMESFAAAIAGDRQYGSNGIGASFGFIGHLARRLPSPVLFDDPKIAEYIFGNVDRGTAAVDTSGRMWVYAPFFEKCLKEEARDKVMVLPLFTHEYLHIALNHTKRMHNFPPDISNIAKDKVINPMAKKMFDAKVQPNFSDIFKLAHGNCPEDARFDGLAEETVAKLLMKERREALENKGTIHIKKLIIEDGTVTKINKLTAGKGEIKEYDTITVKVQDLGMMDKVDTEFDCATLEVDEIDNRLKTRRRPGQGEESENEERGPIEIPTESDDPSQGNGKGKGSGKPSQGKPQDGQGDQDADNDPGRKSLDDIRKDMANKNGGAGQGSGKPQDPGQDPSQGGGGGQQDPSKSDTGSDPSNGAGGGQQGNQPPAGGQPQGQGQAGGQPSAGNQAGGNPQGGQDPNGNGAGQQPGRVDAGAGTGQGRTEQGGQVGDKNSSGVNNGKGASGTPDDVLGGLIRGNPLNTPGGHEVNLDGLNDWLAENGYEDLLKKMRGLDFNPEQVERAIEISLKEAEKERLIIGSGYAGGHVEDYINTVVRPNSIYKVNFQRRALDFLQGTGNDITSTLDEYGILTYVNPEDMGLPEDDGVYYPGHVQQKPEGAYFVIIDTSGSIWTDKKRLGHLASLALGIRDNKDDMSPDVFIVGADTVVSGKPHFYDEEGILEAIEKGIPLGGGGGTDYALPINQTCAWCKENDVKPLGIIYLGDFEVRPPTREELPEDCPPLLFGGMPHDVVRAETFVRGVEGYAEVFVIEDGLTLDGVAAEEKANASRGVGHSNIQP